MVSYRKALRYVPRHLGLILVDCRPLFNGLPILIRSETPGLFKHQRCGALKLVQDHVCEAAQSVQQLGDLLIGEVRMVQEGATPRDRERF
ncbi:MAG: hypothetical protein OEQ49_12370 [Myxococcales bacterium]|nr:hypothetical protein [Myxococcales bacterium]